MINADEETYTLIEHLESVAKRQEAELRKLMERPELFDVMQACMDEFLNSLNHLYNYDDLVDRNGDAVDVLEIHELIQEDMEATFLKLTGKSYVPEAARQWRLREQEQKSQLNAGKLLRTIMRGQENL